MIVFPRFFQRAVVPYPDPHYEIRESADDVVCQRPGKACAKQNVRSGETQYVEHEQRDRQSGDQREIPDEALANVPYERNRSAPDIGEGASVRVVVVNSVPPDCVIGDPDLVHAGEGIDTNVEFRGEIAEPWPLEQVTEANSRGHQQQADDELPPESARFRLCGGRGRWLC